MAEDKFEAESIDVQRTEHVTITYRDGYVTQFDIRALREECPCATCRGLRDRGEPAYPRPGSPQPLEIVDAELHGGWGLTFTWNDGHSTGIFPFDALRRWSEGADPPFAPDSGLG